MDYPIANLPTAASVADVTKVFYVLIGVLRSLRSQEQFTNFFEWFYPAHFASVRTAVQACARNPEVWRAALKFVKEITSNQSHRLKLEQLNGFIVFKGCCPILSELIKSQLSQTCSSSCLQTREQLELHYKFLKLAMQIVMNVITGRYVHFGVLELYHDTCYIDITVSLFEILVSLDLSSVGTYQSLTLTLYLFLTDFFRANAEMAVLSLSPRTLSAVFHMLRRGLEDSRSVVIISSCAALDEAFQYICREKLKSKSRAAGKIAEFLQCSANILLEICEVLLRLSCYEEGDYMYSLFAPLYGTILLDRRLFDEAERKVMEGEDSEVVRSKLAEELSKLSRSVDFNLDPRNKDRFLCSYTRFKAAARSVV